MCLALSVPTYTASPATTGRPYVSFPNATLQTMFRPVFVSQSTGGLPVWTTVVWSGGAMKAQSKQLDGPLSPSEGSCEKIDWDERTAPSPRPSPPRSGRGRSDGGSIFAQFEAERAVESCMVDLTPAI